MQLREVAALLDARLAPPASGAAAGIQELAAEVTDLAYDSRAVRPGALFFCLPGEVEDGHRWAGDAVRAGAVALVCERPLAAAVPQLLVASARQAMNLVAAPFFGHPSRQLALAGITGTNGKTTIAYMLEAIFAAAGAATGLVGTVESRVQGRHGMRAVKSRRTTPESVDLQRLLAGMVGEGVGYCAIEVTSIGLEQGRLAGAEFAAAGFTNLTQDHLDYHGDLESYYRSKRTLFSRGYLSGRDAFAAVNVADRYGARLAAEVAGAVRTVTLGLAGDLADRQRGAPEPQVLGEVMEADAGGSRLRIRAGAGEVLATGMEQTVHVRLPGRFNAANGLTAAVMARGLGLPPGAVAQGLEGLDRVPGRFELVEAGQDFAVVVDYAHTPDSLARVLAAARDLARPGGQPFTGGRLIAVFGAGGDRDRTKRPLMGQAAAEAADRVYVTSDNPRSEDPGAIMAGIEEGIAPAPPRLGYRLIADRAEAIAAAVGEARPGDVVVIAGKGHETTQSFAGEVVEFSDIEVARSALGSLGSGRP
ncbi:MAG TPA: UDP-N-acetylmuramoyl-L-alanyl-D-glutamate--2,6-diaminopimelate ligase [Actinomycetota bacterium]|nr:UDP-N-acetylmuramoyl-L-alanyl-D-glutamate--2,6-diaminopimelate ligase [Actinomycetota bacterium]